MDQIQKIISRDNEHLKRARRVRDGRESGLVFLEGLRLVDEAARSRTIIENLFVSPEIRSQFDGSELTYWLKPRRIFELPEAVLESLADTQNPQGIIAIAEQPANGPEMISDIHVAVPPVVVFLNEINNPANLGAVIRTAEASGVAGVIISAGSADVFSPKALRAAMGSSLRVPLWAGAKFEEAVDWARANKLRIVAADTSGTQSYVDVDWQIARMLVFGSEAHGLSAAEMEEVDEVVIIPMAKGIESLNLAVACGVILFEARRQSQVR